MTALYVPPTDETDHKKQNQSLQLIGGVTSTNTTNIATNSADITTLQTPNYGLVNSGGALGVSLSKITASLSGDVSLSNIANYFDGPSVAQGTTGTWFVSGTITVIDTAGAAQIFTKLWDGTTVIASGDTTIGAAGIINSISLSGFITTPAGNLRISCRDINSTTGRILFNQTGNSKDSTITAIRIA